MIFEVLNVIFGLGPNGSSPDLRLLSSGSEPSESLYIFAKS